jgi:hypothetical protein
VGLPQSSDDVRPWHREPWPWFIIGLLGAAVLASLITLFIAIASPDLPVVDDAEYDRIKSEMRAQSSGEEEAKKVEPGDTDG